MPKIARFWGYNQQVVERATRRVGEAAIWAIHLRFDRVSWMQVLDKARGTASAAFSPMGART